MQEGPAPYEVVSRFFFVKILTPMAAIDCACHANCARHVAAEITDRSTSIAEEIEGTEFIINGITLTGK